MKDGIDRIVTKIEVPPERYTSSNLVLVSPGVNSDPAKINFLKFLKWYRLFHKIHLRIVSPTSLCTVLERGVFTLYCTQSPPTPLYRGGRFDYMFYCIVYGDTISYIPICLCSPLQLFYCMLCDCCVCGYIERVSVPV